MRNALTIGCSRSNTFYPVSTAGLEVSTVGLGAWSWGDRSGYWGYGQQYGKDDNLTVSWQRGNVQPLFRGQF
jgi:hypothetical protein